ncbi:MAG: preprotein translocase subunit TatA [Halobacteriota archaeon]
MVFAVPAVVGIPGGLELLIILFIFVLLFGIPLTILLFLGYRLTDRVGESAVSDDRLEELESEVAALKERLEDDE